MHRLEAQMAKCAECGIETELHELGVPICPECIAKRERVHPALAILTVELASARDLYHRAMEEFAQHQATSQHLPKGRPDRVETERLEDKAKAAGEKYWETLRLYSEALRKEGKADGEST